MCRGRSLMVLILGLVLFGAHPALAQKKGKSSTPRKRPAPTQQQKAQAPQQRTVTRSTSSWGAGIGYMTWGETIRGTDGTGKGQSIANYAGLTFFLDYTNTKGRWVYGSTFGLGTGKATASEWDNIIYSDAGQRSWMAGTAEAFFFYRMTVNIMMGMGAMGMYRMADWKSADPAVKIDKLNDFTYSPELLFRWKLTPRLTIAKNLNFQMSHGDTIWRWSTIYSF